MYHVLSSNLKSILCKWFQITFKIFIYFLLIKIFICKDFFNEDQKFELIKNVLWHYKILNRNYIEIIFNTFNYIVIKLFNTTQFKSKC